MKTKTLIILIVLIGLGAGGFFLWKNFSLPEAEKEKIEDEEEVTGEQVEEQAEEQAVLPEEEVIPEKEEEQVVEEGQPVLPGEEKEEEVISEEEEEIPKKEEEEATLIPTQITFLDDLIADPDWNSNGSQIVFCIKGEVPTLYLINLDGSGLKEIGPGFDPSWSPIEDKIAYEMNGQIYTMNSNGGDIAQLTTGNSSVQPAWSPDGTKIIYTYYGAEKASIWIMNADGSGKTQLTNSVDGECALPSFSYDGLKIVYAKGSVWNTSLERLPTATNEIWIMNLNGSNKHKIYAPSDSYQWIFQRAWNKKNEILFMKNPLQDMKIPEMFVINSDGTNPRYMVDYSKDSFGIPISFYLDPVWDNSGTKVVAVRKMIDGPQNIVTISVEE